MRRGCNCRQWVGSLIGLGTFLQAVRRAALRSRHEMRDRPAVGDLRIVGGILGASCQCEYGQGGYAGDDRPRMSGLIRCACSHAANKVKHEMAPKLMSPRQEQGACQKNSFKYQIVMFWNAGYSRPCSQYESRIDLIAGNNRKPGRYSPNEKNPICQMFRSSPWRQFPGKS